LAQQALQALQGLQLQALQDKQGLQAHRVQAAQGLQRNQLIKVLIPMVQSLEQMFLGMLPMLVHLPLETLLVC